MYARLIAAPLLLLTLAGCQRGMPPELDHRRAEHRWMIEAYDERAVSDAIITQHTLYPYHFVTGAAALTDVGRHDLAVLAAHHREHPRTINVQQGAADGKLYQQRLATVREQLSAAGVDLAAVTLTDGLPGGDGRASTDHLFADEFYDQPLSQDTLEGVVR